MINIIISRYLIFFSIEDKRKSSDGHIDSIFILQYMKCLNLNYVFKRYIRFIESRLFIRFKIDTDDSQHNQNLSNFISIDNSIL